MLAAVKSMALLEQKCSNTSFINMTMILILANDALHLGDILHDNEKRVFVQFTSFKLDILV